MSYFYSISSSDVFDKRIDSFEIIQNNDLVEFYSAFNFTPFYYMVQDERILLASEPWMLSQKFQDDGNIYNADFFKFDNDLNFQISALNDADVYVINPFIKYSFDFNELRKTIDKNLIPNKNELIIELDDAKEQVKDAFIKSFDALDLNNPIVLFSGGVDSSAIALMLKNKGYFPKLVTLAVRNFQNKDLVEALKVADFLNLKLDVIEVDLTEIENSLIDLIKIIGSRGTTKVEVGLVSYLILKHLSDNYDVFSGLGSEEIFAGYERHLDNPFVECFSGLFNLFHRDYVRDYAIVKSFGHRLILPFLDYNLVKLALKIKNYKVVDHHKKYIFRLVAQELGLDHFAFRKKLAAQYGSSISKALSKIAKANGFKYKKDYLRSLSVNFF